MERHICRRCGNRATYCYATPSDEHDINLCRSCAADTDDRSRATIMGDGRPAPAVASRKHAVTLVASGIASILLILAGCGSTDGSDKPGNAPEPKDAVVVETSKAPAKPPEKTIAAKPAKPTETVDEVDAYDVFRAVITENLPDIAAGNSDADLDHLADTACDVMDTNTPEQVAAQAVELGMDPEELGTVLGAAAGSVCPEHSDFFN